MHFRNQADWIVQSLRKRDKRKQGQATKKENFSVISINYSKLIDVLRGQPTKLIQLVSISEFC